MSLNVNRIVWYCQPVLLTLLACIIVAAICHFTLTAPVANDRFSSSELFELKIPNATLSPEQVVKIQMEGLHRKDEGGLGIFQCYCFATPANRLVTGPFPRFSQLVHNAPFDQLTDSSHYSVGEPTSVGEDERRVLVTTIGEDRRLQVFAFILKRQDQEPFKDCWMTGAVIPLFDTPTPQPELKFSQEVSLGPCRLKNTEKCKNLASIGAIYP